MSWMDEVARLWIDAGVDPHSIFIWSNSYSDETYDEGLILVHPGYRGLPGDIQGIWMVAWTFADDSVQIMPASKIDLFILGEILAGAYSHEEAHSTMHGGSP